MESNCFIKPGSVEALYYIHSCLPFVLLILNSVCLITPGSAGLFTSLSVLSVLSLVHSQVPNFEFEGQTKTRLGNSEVRKIVDNTLWQHLYISVCPLSIPRSPILNSKARQRRVWATLKFVKSWITLCIRCAGFKTF